MQNFSEVDLKTNQIQKQNAQAQPKRFLYELSSREQQEPQHPQVKEAKMQKSQARLPNTNVKQNPEAQQTIQQLKKPEKQIKGVVSQHLGPIIHQQNSFQCNFCFQTKNNQQFQKSFKCEHVFCGACLKTYLQSQINNLKICKCPLQECNAEVNQSSKRFINLQSVMKQKYDIIKFRKNVLQKPNCILCPSENCRKGYIQITKDKKDAQCKQCKIFYCVICRVKSHDGNCESFQQILLKDKFKYKQCFGCKSVVQRNQGCPHMTCKCGSQFCYYCGGQWVVPHRCLRYMAGGQLITDKLNSRLSCLRASDLQYSYTVLGYLSKIPYYIVCLIILSVYLCWSLAVLVIMIVAVLIGSFFSGYIAILYKMCRDGGSCGKVGCILFIIFLPVGFIVGWFVVFGLGIKEGFPKYVQLALSGKLFPCFFCC